MMKGVGKIKVKVNLSRLGQIVKDEFSETHSPPARKDEALRKTLDLPARSRFGEGRAAP